MLALTRRFRPRSAPIKLPQNHISSPSPPPSSTAALNYRTPLKKTSLWAHTIFRCRFLPPLVKWGWAKRNSRLGTEDHRWTNCRQWEAAEETLASRASLQSVMIHSRIVPRATVTTPEGTTTRQRDRRFWALNSGPLKGPLRVIR